MASTYTGLGTEKMTTGENAGTWGSTTNTNLQILEQIAGGYIEKSIAGSAQTTTLSVSDGSTGAEFAHRILKFTGTITGNQVVTIPLDVQQMYILVNGTSGAYTVQFKYASGSGSSLTFATTDKGTKIVYATADDGTNPNIVDTGISTNTLTGVTGDITIDSPTDIVLDADGADVILKDGGTQYGTLTNSSSNLLIKSGSTTAATFSGANVTLAGTVGSGAITSTSTVQGTTITATTAFVPDASDGAALGTTALEFSDLFLADSAVLNFGDDQDVTLTHTDGTGLTLNSTSKLCFYDTALYIHSSTDGQLDLVADTEIQIAATTIDINGAVALNGAITGATNITLSGELDAATLDISGNADIDGTMEADAYTIGSAAFIKVEGTNFTDSLLIGHATTGTLSSASENTIVGIDAGDAITTGDLNTMIGFESGTALTSSTHNTCVGGSSGRALSTSGSSYNTFVGVQSGYTASSSSYANTTIGAVSGYNLSTGDYNTFTGFQAGNAVSTGAYNTLIGNTAGANLVDGSGNIVIGDANTAATDSARTLKITSYDGTTTTNHIISDGSGNMTLAADLTIGDDFNMTTDSSVITFGADSDTTLTHTDGTGLTLNSTNKLCFYDTALSISSSTDGQLDIDADTEVEIATTTLDLNGALDVSGASQFSGAVTVGVDNTGLDVKLFGASAGAYMEWDESADQLRIVGASADATTSTGKLLLATSLTDINANDVIGKIEFQAPLEAGGTDAITVAASIQAIAQGTFSASVNATDLIFYTGHSEANTEKFRFTSEGEIGVGGANYGTDGQVLTSGGAGAAPAWEDVSAASGTVTGKVEGTNFVGSLLVGHSTTGTLDNALSNTAVGIEAMDSITAGDQNTCLGYQSGTALTTGGYNTLLGRATGTAIVDGLGNTAIGYNAGLLISSGWKNIVIGQLAGDNITSGDGNVVIGKADVSSATGDDQLSISDGEDGSVVWMTGDSSANIVLAADLTIGDDFLMTSDSSVITFGADSDTTLTHTDGTGLTLNGTNKLCFYDTALSIHSSTDGQLDLIADTEIQIAATTIDINGAVDISGNTTFGGLVDVNGVADGLVIDADGDTTISSPTDDQIDFEISGADDFTMTANTFTILSGSTIAIAAGGAITNAGTMAPDIVSSGKAAVFGI